MKNKKIILGFLVILITFFTINISAKEYGPDYVTDCNEGLCTVLIYPYQRFYQENGTWKQIDERFSIENCELNYDYCVDQNLYQSNIKQVYSPLMITYKNTKLSFNILNIAGFTQSSSIAEIRDNTVIYKEIYPSIDLKYTYLPTMLKEEIIIKDKNIFTYLNKDIEVEFNLNSYGTPIFSDGNSIQIGNLIIGDLVAYDENELIEMPFTLTNNILKLIIPINWLKNESRMYPIIIDPTITLDNNSIKEDLHVSYNTGVNPNTYLRQDSISSASIGILNTDPPAFSRQRIRAVIEFNTSLLPKFEHITDINLTLFFHQTGNNDNNIIKVFNMEKNSDNYTNNETPCFGNCNFWLDMANGSNYLNLTVFSGFNYFNLSLASLDIENTLSNNLTWFGFGFKANESNLTLIPQNLSKFRPGTWSDVSERPILTITYRFANESEGDIAIQQGILNVLPNATIHNEQQVYTRHSTNLQQLARFDRFAIFNNKRWAFNYITEGETYANMNNLSSTLFTLEITNLSSSQIRQQVEQFISNTKDL